MAVRGEVASQCNRVQYNACIWHWCQLGTVGFRVQGLAHRCQLRADRDSLSLEVHDDRLQLHGGERCYLWGESPKPKPLTLNPTLAGLWV